MKALVTGGTGFIGANIVRELLKQEFDVRVLLRKDSDRRNIEGLSVVECCGDLRDSTSLDNALDGCDVLFHTAASYALWSANPQEVYESNVKGTENILRAAMRTNIKKVIYTSTESTIGIPHHGIPGNEEMTSLPDELSGDYKKSKLMAEKLALKMYRDEGLPLVVVNPTLPIGAYDIKPTPTGQLIVDFLNHKMPAYVDSGLNAVDVQDVALGHVLAYEKGRIGERYILGNKNVTFREILVMLEGITGIEAPKVKFPFWFALGAAYVDEFVSGKVLKKHPRVPLAGVKTARKIRYFDCSRAVIELGMPQTPVETALETAVNWFREKGYAR
jgi:dihydroflavonol-4-reductase